MRVTSTACIIATLSVFSWGCSRDQSPASDQTSTSKAAGSSATSAPRTAKTAKPTAPVAKPVDPAAVKAVLAEIEAERRWKTKVSEPTAEFLKAVGPKFDHWQGVLTQLSAAGQHDEADQICQAIVELRNHWGTAIFPPEKYDAFARDRFVVGSLRVDGAQFFEPVPFYKGDDRIKKMFRFSVYRGKEVVVRYYLELSQLSDKPYHVLGRMDATTGKHQQVQPYGAKAPTYWTLKKRMIADLAGAAAPKGPSTERK